MGLSIYMFINCNIVYYTERVKYNNWSLFTRLKASNGSWLTDSGTNLIHVELQTECRTPSRHNGQNIYCITCDYTVDVLLYVHYIRPFTSANVHYQCIHRIVAITKVASI